MKNNKKRLPYTLLQVMVSIREQLNLRIDNRQYPKYGHKKYPYIIYEQINRLLCELVTTNNL